MSEWIWASSDSRSAERATKKPIRSSTPEPMKNSCLVITLGVGLLTQSIPAQSYTLNGTVDELRKLLGQPSERVSLTAMKSHRAQADQLVVSATVKTESKTLAEAIAANRKSREELNTALAAQGIGGTNLVYKPFSFSTESTFFGRKVRSYSVASRTLITVHSETEFTDVIRTLESNGEAWKFDSFNVRDSAEAANWENAMRKTLAEIKRRQALYEGEFGVELTPVSFRESSHHGRRYGPAPTVAAQAVSTSVNGRYRRSEPETASFNDTFGEVSYSAALTVEFSIKRSAK